MKLNHVTTVFASLLLMLSVVLSTGCGGGIKAPPSDIQSANALLVEALDAWKSGESAKDLKSRSPQIYFAEDLLARGAKLTGYTIETPGEMYGTNVRFSVSLECEDGDQQRSSQVQYLVCTTPAQCISRQE